jgi:hypothetical protein
MKFMRPTAAGACLSSSGSHNPVPVSDPPFFPVRTLLLDPRSASGRSPISVPDQPTTCVLECQSDLISVLKIRIIVSVACPRVLLLSHQVVTWVSLVRQSSTHTGSREVRHQEQRFHQLVQVDFSHNSSGSIYPGIRGDAR